jgi:hypothetical protein
MMRRLLGRCGRGLLGTGGAVLLAFSLGAGVAAETHLRDQVRALAAAESPRLLVLYRDLDAPPELSFGGTPDQVPVCPFWLGVGDAERMEASQKSGQLLLASHSSGFLPLLELSLPTGIEALASAVLELAPKPR